MRGTLFLVVLYSVGYSKALECGIGKVNSEDVKKTLSTCIKNNATLERIWEMASSSATPASDSSESSSMEDDQPQTQSAKLTRVVKRASNVQPKTVPPPTDEQNDKSTVQPDESTTPSNSEFGDSCIVQCVFKQLGMTDDNGLPDHSKIVEGLLKNVTERELSIFLQEAAGDCFQQMDQDKNMDSCAYSTQLVSCLANKGRMNCEDWPAGNLPF
uniref:Odorant-binding protein n=1 Tax=Anoplophora chinensis TaxID=217632 RepID=A0A2H4ZB35_ANOCN|nr:odorant-binding protein [Anoplophora chinensis]